MGYYDAHSLKRTVKEVISHVLEKMPVPRPQVVMEYYAMPNAPYHRVELKYYESIDIDQALERCWEANR